MRKWFRVGRARAFGARIHVHWSVLVAVAFVAALSLASPVHAAVAIVSYLGVITLHELGHAAVARSLGYNVDSIRIAFLHGRCDYHSADDEWDDVRIAWGGVLAQLVVAVPILIVASVFDELDFGYLAPAVVFLGYVNLLVALVNLAPGADLDGRVAWRAVPLLRQQWNARRATKKTLRALIKRR